ncbi:RWP-RK domain-containing protein [Chloropicon primus]|uniref:RWP-RK domain-containing protein n=1 Tax=Chloropicon primus TaxID=1764295 RepID=A0A5B8MLW4_9CHLO|nr:hypothetical protein A3770_06p41660 [Chloropicon primus]UPR00859.1 RWP-RK domain-containing protein [Chloropicon primus]|eukprot:QDZ21648.1 hypothetical protein A3770_06p41660 [Chloropicon primus]
MRKSTLNGYVSKVRGLSKKEISSHFHLPIIVAAKKLRVCVTALKSRCRQLGISRWPYRKVKKVDSVIKALVDQKSELRLQKSAEKGYLQNALDIRNHILSNPNSTAHLQIKKKKNPLNLSDDTSSGDTSSDQLPQDAPGSLLKTAQSKISEEQARGGYNAVDKNANLNANAKAWLENNGALLQNLLTMQQGFGQAPAPMVWPQIPTAMRLVNNSCRMQERDANALNFLAYNSNLNTQNALLQMAIMQNTMPFCALQNKPQNNYVLQNRT